MDVRAGRARRVLWQKYLRAMGGAALPRPFDEVALIARLAERRGRPIELIPVGTRPDLPCGLLMVTDHADCIIYATDTSVLHQRHILLHEAAHLVCGHDRAQRERAPDDRAPRVRAPHDRAARIWAPHDPASPAPAPEGHGPVGAAGEDAPPSTHALLPHLPDALVRRVLGRTVYTEPQEHEAELLASLICSRAAREAGAPQLVDGQQRRLGTMFGAPAASGRPRG
jgi:hypothetical protein